ncbi:MAG: LuxR C-terminal-related transcriptional regulator [Brevinematia bacterium]
MKWKGFNKRKRIGVIIHQYQYDIWEELIERAGEQNVDLTFFVGRSLNSPYETEKPQNYIYDFIDSSLTSIDGLIIFSGMIANFVKKDELIKFIDKFREIPSVSVFTEVENIPSIIIDNASGMEKLMSHLIDFHRFKRFAFVKGPENNVDAMERFKAFLNCLEKYGLSVERKYIIEGDFRFESGIEALKKLKNELGSFDAIVSSNDTMAIGILNYIENNKDIFNNYIPVTGFDNVINAVSTKPSLTTVDVKIREVTSFSLTLLLDLINGKEVKEKIYIEPELIIRESCGCKHIKTTEFGKEKYKNTEITKKIYTILEGGDDSNNEKSEKIMLELLDLIKESKYYSLNSLFREFFLKEEKRFSDRRFFDEFFSLFDYLSTKMELEEKGRLNNFYNEIFMLRILTRDISSDISLEELKAHLIEKLPSLGISDFLLFVNEKPDVIPQKEKLRCVLFIKNNKNVLLENNQSLGDIIKNFTDEKNYIFLPLSGKKEVYGIIVINYIKNDIVYEILREQLSSTLKYIELFQKNLINEENLEKMVKILNELKEKYFSMLEFLPSAVFEINKDLSIEFLNKNAKEMLMVKESESKLNFMDFVYPEDRDRFYEIFNETKYNDSGELNEIRMLKRSGAIIHFLFNMVRIYEGGKFSGIRVSGFDIRPILSKSLSIDESFFREFNLSSREKEVLKLWSQGYQIKEIASSLFIAESTVKIHIGSIYSKLDVKNKYEFFEFIKNYQIKRFGYESFLFSVLSQLIKN